MQGAWVWSRLEELTSTCLTKQPKTNTTKQQQNRCVCVSALLAQSCLTLGDPVDCSPPGSSSMGLSRQECWSGWPFPSPGDLPDPGMEARSPALHADALPSELKGFAMLCYAKSLQSCPTLCDPIDGSLPGSPVPGILQARTLEWVGISFSNA